jgi:predicted ATPase
VARFLTRVQLKNYKSVAACNIELSDLTFLVGPNGSGKSNFLDALRFVTDSLRTTLDHALRDRGGINEVRRRSGGHPTHFAIRLDFDLPGGDAGHYSFEVGAKPRGGFGVKHEQCFVGGSLPGRFEVQDGKVVRMSAPGPAAAADRLYLVSASGLEPFRRVWDALANMGFYSLNPEVIRDLQTPDATSLLARDGSNLTSVLARIKAADPDRKDRIEEYLSRVVPGVHGADPIVVGHKETVQFRQNVKGASHPWRFNAVSMSDGTLRALGILVCLFQSVANDRDIPLVGIEEPEVALHPAASGVLLDALREASRPTQVIVTSHSPDLLDQPDLGNASLLAVDAEDGVTQIAPIDQAGREALRDRLYTAGELLRMNQLAPDPDFGANLNLFDPLDPQP